MKTLREWSTLENWNRASDLAAKLAAIIGVLAAISFFSARPNLTISTWCRTPISEFTPTVGSYRADDIKVGADFGRAMQESNRLEGVPDPFQGGGGLSRKECSSVRAGGVRENYLAAISRSYPEVKRGTYPLIAYRLSEILSPQELDDVLPQIARRHYIELAVTVHNTGWGKATNVRLKPPDGLRMADRDPKYVYPENHGEAVPRKDPIIDVGSGKRETFYFNTSPGTLDVKAEETTLFPEAETDPSINVPLLLIVSALLFGGIWIPVVIKDIKRVGLPRTSTTVSPGSRSSGIDSAGTGETGPDDPQASGKR